MAFPVFNIFSVNDLFASDASLTQFLKNIFSETLNICYLPLNEYRYCFDYGVDHLIYIVV